MQVSVERIKHTDGDRHHAFLDYVARVFPGVDFRRWHAFGGWTSAYEAHAHVEGGAVVACAAAQTGTPSQSGVRGGVDRRGG